MLIGYLHTLPKYPKISLSEERRLIAKAKKGSQKEIEEIVLRHVGFIIFRIYKKIFPIYIERFGEEMLAFRNRLEENGIHSTIRTPRGKDVAAACGQLRHQHLEK